MRWHLVMNNILLMTTTWQMFIYIISTVKSWKHLVVTTSFILFSLHLLFNTVSIAQIHFSLSDKMSTPCYLVFIALTSCKASLSTWRNMSKILLTTSMSFVIKYLSSTSLNTDRMPVCLSRERKVSSELKPNYIILDKGE